TEVLEAVLGRGAMGDVPTREVDLIRVARAIRAALAVNRRDLAEATLVMTGLGIHSANARVTAARRGLVEALGAVLHQNLVNAQTPSSPALDLLADAAWLVQPI